MFIRLILILSLLLPAVSWADVAHDNASESHGGTTGSASEASFTWNLTPVGTPRGILVFVCGLSAASNDATSVTYGGSAMTAVSGGLAVDALTELSATQIYFLGSSIPTGLQAVVVNRNNNANIMYAVAISVTALSDTATHDAGIVLLQENNTVTEQNVTDGSPGTNSVRYAGGASGIDIVSSILPGANSTALQSIDIGNNVCVTARETTAGQGSRAVGFDAVSDDRALVHVAIKETGVNGPGALQSGGVNVVGAGL